MADPYVKQATGVFEGTVGSTDLIAGAPVYFDGTDWEKADATDMTKYAEAICINNVASGSIGAFFCRRCIIVDTDTSAYTQGDNYFLATTAGTITATRPTGNSNLKQCLGFALSANELDINIRPVREKMLWVDLQTPYACAVTTDGDWAGKSFGEDADAVHGTQVFPENTVGLEIAYAWLYIEDALITSGSITVDVSAGVSDEPGTTTTDGIASTALLVTTADDLCRVDITEAFDGTGIVEPGNHFGIDIAKANETSGQDFRAHGAAVIVKVV